MDRWRVHPGEEVDLQERATRSRAGAPGDRQQTLAELASLRREIAEYQHRLWAEGTRSLLVVLQAPDTAGKDSTIRAVFSGCNPQGVQVSSFVRPTREELSHDFLWRAHKAAPARGEIGIFNRSHYEDVLVVRVQKLVPEDVWRPRYELINAFERQLGHAGTTILKFYLHISKEEQAQRLRARLDDPAKRWKFNPDDVEKRRHWDDLRAAYAEALHRTSTEAAPWFVIPSDRRWYRKWAVARVVADTLQAMDPKYPDPPDLDLDLEII